MARVTYGAKKIEMGDFNPTTGESSNWVEVPVYRDTITINEPEATVQEHFQQGRSSPRVRKITPQPMAIAFQLMDTDPDALQAALGGTVTTVNGAKKFNAPKYRGEQTKSLRITVEDDSIITVPRFSHFVRPNFAITETTINVLDVNGSVMDTGLAEVPDWTWEEAPVGEP